MRSPRALSCLLFAGLFSGAFAQEPKKPDGKKPADPKTWMCLRGPLLWEETFANGAWSKEWSRYKGNYVVEKGQVLCHGTPQEVINDPKARELYFGSGIDADIRRSA